MNIKAGFFFNTSLFLKDSDFLYVYYEFSINSIKGQLMRNVTKMMFIDYDKNILNQIRLVSQNLLSFIIKFSATSCYMILINLN